MYLNDLSDIYKVNDDLKNDIFSRIPADFSKLEQAIFIYNELCQKLNYSLDYYMDEQDMMGFFCDAKNIEKVDGKRIKDVVCFTFDRIFLRLLYDREIIDDYDFWENAGYAVMFGHIKPEHSVLEFGIDGKRYTVDATMGVFKNSDLSQSKFVGYRINGWFPKGYQTAEDAKEFRLALEKVQALSTNKALQDDVFEYVKQKFEKNEYKKCSLKTRAEMFMDFVCEYGHFNEIQAISYAHKLKHLMFTPDETNQLPQEKQKISIQYIFNTKTCRPSYLVFFNIDEEIKIYQVDLVEPNGKVEPRTMDELQKQVDRGDLKYLVLSSKLHEMIEPVEAAVEFCKKEKQENETRTE